MNPNYQQIGYSGSNSLSGYNMVQSSTAPSTESPFSQEMGRLTSVIAELDIQIDGLRKALEPVLMPSPSDPAGNAVGQGRESRGHVVDAVEACVDRIQDTTQRISRIRSLLTV